MLTGLYPPTSGTIIINGKNLQTDLAAVRRELGVCPQQDVLFDTLTVREHLLLFASIKAPQWTRAELQQHVRRSAPTVRAALPRPVREGGWRQRQCPHYKKQLALGS